VFVDNVWNVQWNFSKSRYVEEILTIEIKPGWKKGTKITFPEKGNQEPGVVPADLTFVIDEKPHALYRRDGNDLVINQEITLLEALTGKTLDLTTLDGRSLVLPLTDIVKPGAEVVVPDEGMPISKEPGKKGNLRVKLDVKYPSRLTPEQKSDLRRVLGGISWVWVWYFVSLVNAHCKYVMCILLMHVNNRNTPRVKLSIKG